MIDDTALPTATEAPPDVWAGPEAKAARIAQARTLREQAGKGGLRFEAYLPPELADWLLDQIERGIFADPSEAVFVILGEHRELEPHADLREELLRRTVQAAMDDPRPSLSGNEVETQLRELADTPLPEAAVWRKVP
jgi:antitoxin ParD1/3/4